MTHQGAQTNKARAVARAENILSMRDKGLTYDEIADTLKMSADAIRQIVSRHKKRTATQEPVRKYRVRRNEDASS